MMRKISFHFVTVCGYLLALGFFAYSFETDYEYHYEYKANSVVLGKFPVVTIAKFRIQPLMQSNGSIICHLHMNSLTQSAGGKTVSNPVGWNFKRGFEFELSEDGLIKEVAHHNEDHHDVINFKKVLASVFSAIRKPRTSTRKTFNNWEQDHSGYLQHRYEVQNTTMGYKVDKFHESEGKVYRKHRKTLHYTNTGVIEYIRADDKVIIQNKNKQKKQERRYSVFGTRAIEEETSGDVSDIESNTKTEVRLVNKIKIHGMNRVLPIATELKVKDSIAAKKGIPQVYLKYDEVQEVINSKVACIELSKNTVNEKRTNCFVELLETVNRLHKDEYKKLASRELSQHCWSNNTMCISRRNVFIDLLLVKGENITQDLTIQHFLQNKDVNETDLFRIFFHIGKIEAPTLEFLEAVERLCLEPYNSKIRYTAMTKNQKHACLALGTLIKTCRNNSLHIEKTDILLNSLKQWLTLHNQTHYTELQSKKRPHRSVDRNDRELHNYTYSKMVLIHALGNTGSSRDHLLTYMRPGEGDNSWRRAAILAMRHFGCVESSTALFNLVVNDDHSVVKQQALEMFENHPLSNKSIPEHRDIILSRFYNYKTLMRTKRGILDVDLKDGFFFSLKLPGIQWTKQVGNDALGAAFGISLTNELEIEIKPLRSHAMINMYENAFAKVMLGWFNVEQYLFRAHACYRGHAGYDINILKAVIQKTAGVRLPISYAIPSVYLKTL